MQGLKDLAEVVFKLALAAGIVAFLLLYARNEGVGRYQYVVNGDLEYVMDTATGVVYQGGYSMNHLTGEEKAGPKPRKQP